MGGDALPREEREEDAREDVDAVSVDSTELERDFLVLASDLSFVVRFRLLVLDGFGEDDELEALEVVDFAVFGFETSVCFGGEGEDRGLCFGGLTATWMTLTFGGGGGVAGSLPEKKAIFVDVEVMVLIVERQSEQ